MLTLVVVAVLAGLFARPAAAAAACTPAEVREARLALKTARSIRAGSPGRTRAIRTAQRARKRCTAARYARVVAELTKRHGRAVNGRTYAHRGIPIVGASGMYAMDWPRAMRAAARMKTSAKRTRKFRRLKRMGAPAAGGIVWPADPTRVLLDPALQHATVVRLGATGRAAAARLAGPSLTPLATTRARRWFARQPLVDHARLVDQLELAAWRTRRAHKVRARSAPLQRNAVVLNRRAVASVDGGWMRVGGSDATPAQVRALARHLQRAMRHGTMPGLRSARKRVNAIVRTPALVRYRQLPTGAFYPKPRDGHLDARFVRFSVDKPAVAVLRVFAANGAVLYRAEREVRRNTTVQMGWDGRDSARKAATPGDYRYVISTRDPFRNRRAFAGIGAFQVRADTTAPAVVSGTAIRYRFGIKNRYFHAQWRIREAHSPKLRAEVRIVGNGHSRRLRIPGHADHAGERNLATKLPTGTYKTYLWVRDGSGNTTLQRVGTVVVVNRKR